MHLKMLADLETVMESWMNEWAERPEWPDAVYPSDLARRMAEAAAAVFDAAVAASRETEAEAERERPVPA